MAPVCADATGLGSTVFWTPPNYSLDCATSVPGENASFYVEFNLPESSNTCWTYSRVQRIGSNNLRLFQSSGGDTYFIAPFQYFNNTSGTAINMELIVPSGNFSWKLDVLDATNNSVWSSTISNITSTGLKTITIPNSVPNGVYKLKYSFIDSPSGSIGASNHIEVDRIYYDATIVGAGCSGGINLAVTSNYSPGDYFPVGSTQVVYTATYTPVSGNTSTNTCTFNVEVNKTTLSGVPTSATCNTPDGSIQVTATSAHSLINNLSFTIDGNPVTLSGLSSSTNTTTSGTTTTNTTTVTGTIPNKPAGTYTIVANNSVTGCSDSKVITVLTTPDTQKPVITLASASSLGCNPTPAQIAAAFGTAIVTDNCSSGLTATGTVATEIGSGCTFSTTKNWTVTDVAGNTQTASQTVNYTRDIALPTISLASATALGCNPTPAQIAAAFGSATVTDGCSTGLTATGTVAAETGSGCAFSTTKNWTVTDACGNIGIASQT
ncbi:HYR-like domain-containing protein, partial [Flavobacterium fluvii]|uniref:HYR-like domain-containing protein n=1 Tax=Flavobacterium fluvii TaxID=468056 RepID=UPI00147C5E8F